MMRNKFYDLSLAREVEEQEKYLALINKARGNPGVLDTLSFEELGILDAYYYKLIEEKEAIIARKRTVIKRRRKTS